MSSQCCIGADQVDAEVAFTSPSRRRRGYHTIPNSTSPPCHSHHHKPSQICGTTTQQQRVDDARVAALAIMSAPSQGRNQGGAQGSRGRQEGHPEHEKQQGEVDGVASVEKRIEVRLMLRECAWA
jgi:hypothetical protein